MNLHTVVLAVVDRLLGVVSRRRHLGVERVPVTGPVLVVSNHLSVVDPLVLACALRRSGRRATFLAMVEAFSWPVVGWLLRRTGQIPVRRAVEAGRDDALVPALERLLAGECVALYPEGRITTRTDSRLMPRGRTGAVRLALAAGCPIVPVAQWGAQELWSRDRGSRLLPLTRVRGRRVLLPRRPRVTLVVGEPIGARELRERCGSGESPEGVGADVPPLHERLAVRDVAGLREGTALVMERIAGLLEEIAGPPDLSGGASPRRLVPPAGTPEG